MKPSLVNFSFSFFCFFSPTLSFFFFVVLVGGGELHLKSLQRLDAPTVDCKLFEGSLVRFITVFSPAPSIALCTPSRRPINIDDE